MTFSLSRCHTKKAPSQALPAASKSRAKSSSARRRKRPSPPIPCYKAYSRLERMEEEFLCQVDKEPRVTKEKFPLVPSSRLASSLPSFSSSEDDDDDDDDDALLGTVFSKNKPSNSRPCHSQPHLLADTEVEVPPQSKAATTPVALSTGDMIVTNTRRQGATPHAKESHEEASQGGDHVSLDDHSNEAPVVFHEEAEDIERGEIKPRDSCPIFQFETLAATASASLPETTTGPSNTTEPTDISRSHSSNISAVTDSSRSQMCPKISSADTAPLGPDQLPTCDGLQLIKDQIDVIFSSTDMQTSLKNFLAQLKTRLGRVLTVKEKTMSKAYIKELVNRRIRCSDESADAVDEVSDPKRRNEVVPKENRTPVPPQLSMDAKPHTSSDSNNASARGLQPMIISTRNSGDISRSEPVTKKRVMNVSPSNLPTAAAQNEFDAEDKMGHNAVPKKRLPEKRKRGRRLLKEDTSTEKENVPDDQGQRNSTKPTKSIARKRARKGTCALCTTCPCSKSLDTMDKNGGAVFARSDTAVEKALIRRVQKMEKTCELNEGRLETVRRKLKQHRREIWKKKENNRKFCEEETVDRFLPDDANVEVTSGMEGNSLPKDTVNHAQKVIFPEPPYYQATLTQLMGGSNKRAGAEEGGGTRSNKEGLAAIPEEMDETKVAVNDDGTPPMLDSGEEEYMEYSKGVQYKNRIHREEWKRESSCTPNLGDNKCSLWEVLAIQQKAHELLSVPPSQNSLCITQEQTSRCSWDILFQNDESAGCENDGIGQLVGLFDDSGFDADASPGEPESSADDCVNLSALSQTGKTKAAELISSIENDSRKVEILCPNWKENLAFAMLQNDANEIRAALEKVRQKRTQMLEYKRRIVEAWERQDSVLEVFEKGLSTSLGRLDVL